MTPSLPLTSGAAYEPSGASSSTSDGRPSNRPPKRRKTQRACVYCREHKLRCEFDGGRRNEDDGTLICKHCADFGIECIVTAPPIDKRKLASASRSKLGFGHSDTNDSTPRSLYDTKGAAFSTSANGMHVDDRILDDPRYSGESSLSALVSHFVYIIQGREQQVNTVHRSLSTDQARPTGTDNFLLLSQARYPPPLDGTESKFIDARIDQRTIRVLLDTYLTYIKPLNSIVSRKEVLASVDTSTPDVHIASLSPVGFAVLCLAAMYRNTPRYAREALLFHQRYRSFSVFRSSLETVQSLLLLCLSIEMMAPDTNDAAGMCLNALGLAIRMAHDLGMHRDVSRLGVPAERKRRLARVWSALVIQDRWYALCYGQPALIHMEDCDAPKPSVYEDEQDPALATASTPAPYLMHSVHYEMAIVVGRVHKLGFGPRGLKSSSYREIREVISDIQQWLARLPPSLDYAQRTMAEQSSTVEAGWLFSMRVTIDFLLYRIALNMGPENAPFDPKETWKDIVQRSSEALEWLSSQEGLHCLDSYSVTLYFLVQCSIIQYYSACQGGSLHGLRVARQSMRHRGTVATAATSRSQIYDPYGPEEHARQMDHTMRAHPPTSTSETGAQNQSSNGTSKNSFDGSSGRSSPTPESGSGPPRLLRLRVKISSLLGMLLEIAEHRRAVVLAQRHEQFDAPSTNGTAASVGEAAPRQIVLHPLDGEASNASKMHRVRATAQNQVPRYAVGVKQHHEDVANPSPNYAHSPRPMPGPRSFNNSPNVNDASYPSPSVRYAAAHSERNEQIPVQGPNLEDPSALARIQQPTEYQQMPPYPSHDANHPAHSMTDAVGHVPGMTSALGPQPPALVPPFVPPTMAFHGLAGEGGLHASGMAANGNDAMDGGQPAAALFNILTPRNVEDLDLMTIQRWADAVLLDPARRADMPSAQQHPLQQQQHPQQHPQQAQQAMHTDHAYPYHPHQNVQPQAPVPVYQGAQQVQQYIDKEPPMPTIRSYAD